MRGRFLDGLALGLLLGFVISTGTLWLIDSTQAVVREFADDHLTHFFTLTAAGFALWGVSRQIQSNVELAEHHRKAKLDAARSSLPIVLSNIHEMCSTRCDAISRGDKTRPEGKHWEITDFELSTLRSCIEHAEENEKELMQQIIRVYQVLIARWRRSEFVDLFSSDDLEEGDYRILDRLMQFDAMQGWLTLRAISDALFDYARGEDSNPNKEEMKKSVFLSLRFINSGGSDGDGGWNLTNNTNYSNFLDRLIKKNHVTFIDDDWK